MCDPRTVAERMIALVIAALGIVTVLVILSFGVMVVRVLLEP